MTSKSALFLVGGLAAGAIVLAWASNAAGDSALPSGGVRVLPPRVNYRGGWSYSVIAKQSSYSIEVYAPSGTVAYTQDGFITSAIAEAAAQVYINSKLAQMPPQKV